MFSSVMSAQDQVIKIHPQFTFKHTKVEKKSTFAPLVFLMLFMVAEKWFNQILKSKKRVNLNATTLVALSW